MMKGSEQYSAKQAAAKVEQRFSAGRMVENTIQVYKDVLKKRQVT